MNKRPSITFKELRKELKKIMYDECHLQGACIYWDDLVGLLKKLEKK